MNAFARNFPRGAMPGLLPAMRLRNLRSISNASLGIGAVRPSHLSNNRQIILAPLRGMEPSSTRSASFQGFVRPQRRFIHHFDTRKFAVQLEREGFTSAQADAILKSLSMVLAESVAHMNSNLVSKDEFSSRVYQQKVDFTKLKSELQTLDRADVGRVSEEYERLTTDIEKTRQRFKESVAKERASVRLDLNLEKGRSREQSAGHELKLQELNSRIDSELSNFKTQIEGTKVQVLQWLIGVCTGTFALVLAYIRLLT